MSKLKLTKAALHRRYLLALQRVEEAAWGVVIPRHGEKPVELATRLGTLKNRLRASEALGNTIRREEGLQ